MTVGGKGTKLGALSSLQCPEITRVQLITNVDGTQSFILGQSGQKHAEEMQRAQDAMNKKEMEASVLRTAKLTHRSNLVLVNAAVEQSTRAKGMQTAMASFMGLEEDQLKDAKEKHEDGMPTFARLEVEKLENPGDPYYNPDYGPDQLYGPYPYNAVWGVEEQCEGSREKVDRKQGVEEVNFTKEDLRSVEKYLGGSTGSKHPPNGGGSTGITKEGNAYEEGPG